MRLMILTLTIFLSSCTTNIRPQLALPEPLVLPKISGIKCPKQVKFTACFNKDNYRKLVNRDVMQGSRIKTLRKIIEKTRK